MRTGQNIYKRKDGRWEARIPLGIRANGRRYFKCFYGKTYQEARNRKQDYEKNIPLTKEIVTTSPDTFSSSAYGWPLRSRNGNRPPMSDTGIIWRSIFYPNGSCFMCVRLTRRSMTL